MYRREDETAAANPFIAAVMAASNHDIQVWPENWPVVELFGRLGTQWNVGMSGPTGLRYEAIYPLLDRFVSDDEEWKQAFDDLQIMERAALDAMREED